MTEILAITPDNFDEYKEKIIKVIQDLKIEDIDPDFRMSFEQGIKGGNHAYECNTCNVLHFMMSYIIEQHRENR